MSKLAITDEDKKYESCLRSNLHHMFLDILLVPYWPWTITIGENSFWSTYSQEPSTLPNQTPPERDLVDMLSLMTSYIRKDTLAVRERFIHLDTSAFCQVGSGHLRPLLHDSK